MPEVSVLMTVYNGMPYLPRAVESVLAQTLQDFQFVIVNDGSTDETVDFLNSLDDPRVLVLHQENRGTAVAANNGLSKCDGEFVARMDSDDVSLPERLERQRDFLRERPEAGLVGTQVVPLGDSRTGSSLRLPCTHDKIYTALTLGKHSLAHSSIMCRTAILRRIGGYWSVPMVDDWDMMLRMGEEAQLANLNTVLHQYRVHDQSLNGSQMRRMRWSIDYACDLAHRRRANRPPITYVQFMAAQAARPLWQRAAETINLHARTQYRHALADLYGGRRLRGTVRMGWAALCSPKLTFERLIRFVKPQRKNQPHISK